MTDYNLAVLVQILLDRAKEAEAAAGMKDLSQNTDEVTKSIKKIPDASALAAKALRRNAALMSKELRELKEAAGFIKTAADPLFKFGVAGFAAISLSAKNYIDNTKESNAITKEWAASSQKVQDAQMRIGKVSAEAILPLYEKLADIASKAADFAEKHPGVIEGGLKASIVAAGLGGIGLLVAKGITLYADIKMIAVGDMQLLAAKIMADAANKQVLAATEAAGAKGAGTIATTAGGVAATAATGTTATTAATTAGAAAGLSIGEIAAFTALAIAAQTAVATVGQALGRLAGLSTQTTDVLMTLLTAGVYPLFKGLGEWINEQTGMNAAVDGYLAMQKDATKTTSDATIAANQMSNAAFNVSRNSEGASRGLNTIKTALLTLLTAGLYPLFKEIGKWMKPVPKNNMTTESSNSLNPIPRQQSTDSLTSNMGSLSNSIDNAANPIYNAANNSMDLLSKSIETTSVVANNSSARWAQSAQVFGNSAQLAAQNVSSAANQLVQTAITAKEFLQQQMEMAAAYKEAQTQGNKEKESFAEAIKKQQENFDKATKKQQEVFWNAVGINLNTIKQTTQQAASAIPYIEAYKQNLIQSEKYISLSLAQAHYTGQLTAQPPIHDYTGYAYTGMYAMAQNGQPQLVLSGTATNTAERILGGKLNEQMVMSAILRGGGRGNSYVDNRRFAAGVSAADRRAIRQDTLDVWNSILSESE